MNPAYQGQLDVFCAAYAVINAMRHINATRLLLPRYPARSLARRRPR